MLIVRRYGLGSRDLTSAAEGNFAVVGLDNPYLVLFYFFCFTLIECIFIFMPHTAARCCDKQQQKSPRAQQQYTSLLIPCAHGKLNGKQQHRTTPKPKTRITVVEEEAISGGSVCERENGAPKRIQCTRGTATTTTTTHGPHDKT